MPAAEVRLVGLRPVDGGRSAREDVVDPELLDCLEKEALEFEVPADRVLAVAPIHERHERGVGHVGDGELPRHLHQVLLGDLPGTRLAVGPAAEEHGLDLEEVEPGLPGGPAEPRRRDDTVRGRERPLVLAVAERARLVDAHALVAGDVPVSDHVLDPVAELGEVVALEVGGLADLLGVDVDGAGDDAQNRGDLGRADAGGAGCLVTVREAEGCGRHGRRAPG